MQNFFLWSQNIWNLWTAKFIFWRVSAIVPPGCAISSSISIFFFYKKWSLMLNMTRLRVIYNRTTQRWIVLLGPLLKHASRKFNRSPNTSLCKNQGDNYWKFLKTFLVVFSFCWMIGWLVGGPNQHYEIAKGKKVQFKISFKTNALFIKLSNIY